MIEKRNKLLFNNGSLPIEFHKLRAPAAGYYFRQDTHCDILSQHVEAGPFTLWWHDVFTRKDIVILPYTPYPILVLHYMYEDSLHIERPNKGTFSLQEKEYNLFHLQPGLHKIPMEEDKKILSVHVNISPEHIPGLIATYPEIKLLLNKKGKCRELVNEQPHHINLLAELLIQKMISCKYTGTSAYYYYQRCCLDLLLNFVRQDATCTEPFLFTNMLNIETFTRVFNHLADHPFEKHNIAELAYMEYLTFDELTIGFYQHFSISISDFIHMRRMMKTYHLLSKDQLPLSDVAEVGGFSSVEEMVAAVQDYYGCGIRQMKS
jgi:AraC-like DNA-binding protein